MDNSEDNNELFKRERRNNFMKEKRFLPYDHQFISFDEFYI